MNVNAESLHGAMENQVMKGRTSVEAAGEALWLANEQLSASLLSKQTHDEMTQVINEWLAHEVGVPSDEIGLYEQGVMAYSRFLAERVRFDAKSQPMQMIEEAWREWRRQGG